MKPFLPSAALFDRLMLLLILIYTMHASEMTHGRIMKIFRILLALTTTQALPVSSVLTACLSQLYVNAKTALLHVHFLFIVGKDLFCSVVP